MWSIGERTCTLPVEHFPLAFKIGRNATGVGGACPRFCVTPFLMPPLRRRRFESRCATRDRESGILSVEYYLSDLTVGTSLHLPHLSHKGLPRNQITGEKLASVTARTLLLEHGHTYRVDAHAINGVGLAADPCQTTTTLVDTTPPRPGTVTVVFDDDSGLLPHPPPTDFQFSTSVIRVAARNFTEDVSDIEAFYVSVVRSDGVPLAESLHVGLREYVTLDVQLSHGDSFQAIWRAVNLAGLSSKVASQWVTVDATPPIFNDVVRDTVGGRPAIATLSDLEDVSFVGASEFELRVLAYAGDRESGITSATWCVGSFPGSCEHSEAIEIDVSEGELARSVAGLVDAASYYSTLRVTNGAGNTVGLSTSGFQIDTKPPSCGQVFDGTEYDRQAVGPSLLDGLVWAGPARRTAVALMSAAWLGFVDYGAGIAGYALAIVPQGLVANATDFKAVGLAGSAMYTLRLDHAETYVAVVSSLDRLGNEVKCTSDGVIFDATPPDVSNVTLASGLAVNADFPNVQRVTHLIQVTTETDSDPRARACHG